MSIIDQIDNSPIFKLLESVIFEGPGKIAGAIGAGFSAIGGALSGGGHSMGGGFSFSGMFGGGSDHSQGHSPERSPVAAIKTPVQEHSIHHVDMADIGQFSPNIGGKGSSQGVYLS